VPSLRTPRTTRRGPAAWTQLIRWNTRNDTFEPGQWLRGPVDFHKCDLPPSGERFLYFTKAYKPHSTAAGYGETWTALSRAPYFTALALWPIGDTWYGGGLFVDDRMIRRSERHLRTDDVLRHLHPR
jgi:hypothetical protein